jgi:hypothetical protein
MAMTTLQLSQREEHLLVAALSPQGAVAAASWQEWVSQVKLEDAHYSEVRLLPAVYANLSRVGPSLKLAHKLRGNASYTFTKNLLLAQGCMPIIEELGRHSPVLLAKGIGICIRFDAWWSRAIRDVDIHVQRQSLDKVCDVLAQSGWIPKYGMTQASLVHRSSLRRDSWNFTKGALDLDIHWRVKSGPQENWLLTQMWASAEHAECFGRTLLLQSPELALITSLNHGFIAGDHGDALQAIVDTAWLLPLCRADPLIDLLSKSCMMEQFSDVILILQKIGPSETVSRYHRRLFGVERNEAEEVTCAVGRGLSSSRPQMEKEILRQPARYQLWEALGRSSRIERLLLRFTGPFSRPLTQPARFKDDYDLRDCEAMDRVAGPGWGWPEPGNTCFWSDRADARFLIPLRHTGDHLIVLGISENRFDSPNACINVFGNGIFLASINLRERLSTSEYCLVVPRWVLFGPWLELSLRPKPYLGEEAVSSGSYSLKRSLPVRRLRVLDMQQMSDFLSGDYVPQLYLTILKGQEPQASKFARIKQRMEHSRFRNAPEIPSDFDPVLYVVSHPDLLEHEVDPYEHLVKHGRHEGRLWR